MAKARIRTLKTPISLPVPGWGTLTINQVFPLGFSAMVDINNPLGPQRLVVTLAGYNSAANTAVYHPNTGELISMTVDVPDLDAFSAVYTNAEAAFAAVDQLIEPAFSVWPIEQAIGTAMQTVPGLQAAVEKATSEAQAAIVAATAAKEQSIAQATVDAGQAVAVANATRASMQAQLNDWNRGLTATQALPDGPEKTAAIEYTQSKVTEFAAKLADAFAGVTAAQTAHTTAITDATSAGDQAITDASTAGNAAIATATAPLTATLTAIWQTYLDQWRIVAPALGVTDPEALPLALQGQTKPDGF